jgi:translation initiation factor IF-3
LAKQNRPQVNVRRDAREEEKNKFRVNDMIRIPEARLVGENLEELGQLIGKTVESGIYPTRQLREWAERMALDLVEISPNAKPPVVKITDFNKFLYEKKKKEKEIKAKAAKTVIKEIRFGPNTDDHDFEFKVRHARMFLDEGSKVKAYVQFKGRAIVFKDRGELLLLRFLKELEDLGAAESLPKLEGRRMIVMVAPKKAAAPKK